MESIGGYPKQKGLKTPRYALRTLAPDSQIPVEESTKPNAQHVPGSFVHENTLHVNEALGSQFALNSASSAKPARQTKAIYSSAVQRRESYLRNDLWNASSQDVRDGQEEPLLPKENTLETERGQQTISKAASNADTQSSKSQKLSILSTALLGLSELSHSSKIQDTEDALKNQAHTPRPLSPPPASISENDKILELAKSIVKAKLVDNGPHQSPVSSIVSGVTGYPVLKQHSAGKFFNKNSSYSMIYDDDSNLTAKPSRKQDSNTSGLKFLGRSRIVPTNQHHNKEIQDSANDVLLPSEEIDLESLRSPQKSNKNSESISKTILQLESLLKEALLIANQAADNDEKEKAYGHQPTDTSISKQLGKGLNSRHEDLYAVGSDANDDYDGHISLAYYDGPYRDRPTVPTAKTIQSSSTHAKEVAAHLGLPQPMTPAEEKEPEALITYSMPLLQQPEDVLDSREIPGIGSDVRDWSKKPKRQFKLSPETYELPTIPPKPTSSQLPAKESQSRLLRDSEPSPNIPLIEVIPNHIDTYGSPSIQQRTSSGIMRPGAGSEHASYHSAFGSQTSDDDSVGEAYAVEFASPRLRHPGPRQLYRGEPHTQSGVSPGSLIPQDELTTMQGPVSMDRGSGQGRSPWDRPEINLKNRNHFSLRGHQGFSLSRSHRRAPIARDWSLARKRWVATIACLSTALLGLIIGIYAGEVPAIQYSLADEHHYTILGNVVFFIGLAIPTAFFWPLPLLHGRKPYTLSALSILLALQFPQAVIVGSPRSPSTAGYRIGLLLPRAFAGFVMGFANINFLATLLDLFGSSLQSMNPHQEVVDENDVRRHGGGMGVWLSIWTWSFIGSLGVGFLIGAGIISHMNVVWGFWITIILTVAVLILNVLTPETRRSSYRRSMAEVRTGTDLSRRVARGEIRMHLYSTGPKDWWEEVFAGSILCVRMLMQRGFIILALYLAWIYGQVILVIILLGALTSKYYLFRSQFVGLCVLSISIGALLAVPFQKASLFSRARSHPPRTDSMTFEKRITRSSHMVRRASFMIILPFAGLAITLSFGGRHVPFIVPTIFAGLIGFLSNLAIAERNGIIMETFDTSDLQPGMTGRPRKALPDDVRWRRTNFSCFPRVTAAFAITQSLSFLIAAAATAVGGTVERRVGAKAAIAAVAGVLLVLTLALIGVLYRFQTVQIVPTQRYGTNILSGPEDEWKPVIIGHPSGTTRRISLLEMGGMTRWTEIRRRNRLMSQV